MIIIIVIVIITIIYVLGSTQLLHTGNGRTVQHIIIPTLPCSKVQPVQNIFKKRHLKQKTTLKQERTIWKIKMSQSKTNRDLLVDEIVICAGLKLSFETITSKRFSTSEVRGVIFDLTFLFTKIITKSEIHHFQHNVYQSRDCRNMGQWTDLRMKCDHAIIKLTWLKDRLNLFLLFVEVENNKTITKQCDVQSFEN